MTSADWPKTRPMVAATTDVAGEGVSEARQRLQRAAQARNRF
jgi:hypothetical protein